MIAFEANCDGLVGPTHSYGGLSPGNIASALNAGATTVMEPADDLFGEKRGAGVKDPFGNDWYFGRH